MSDRLINFALNSTLNSTGVERGVKNPLECQHCHMELVAPVRLICQHYFCHDCVVGCEACPLCQTIITGGVSTRGENNSILLVEDAVLRYLIESSHEYTELCANCDQINQPMYFCETCQQPLCGNCREITHKAKIFALHHIKLLEERGRLSSRIICAVHNEPFIVFCQDAKRLMCVECFNSIPSVKKGNFLNIDMAHKMCCEKLEKAVTQLRFFQDDALEQINSRRRFITELDANFKKHFQSLESDFSELFELLNGLKSTLINRLKSDKMQKQKLIESQLCTLENLQGPIEVNLLSASIFCSYASKIDLLYHFADLSKAIQQVMHHKMERLLLSSDWFLDLKQELAKTLFPKFLNKSTLIQLFNTTKNNDMCLDPLLYYNNKILNNELYSTFTHITNDMDYFMLKFNVDTVNERKVTENNDENDSDNNTFKQKFDNHILFDSSINRFHMDDSNATETFAVEMKRIEAPLDAFASEIVELARALVEIQRDITARRCIVNADEFTHLVISCEKLTADLTKHNAFVKDRQAFLRKLWQEQAQRTRTEQTLYRRRVDTLGVQRHFAARILDSARQLRPFATYIAALVTAADERRTPASAHVSPMEQICRQIEQIEPDSRQRVDAIEREEEIRRITKIKEKLLCVPEAQLAKKNLRETKTSNSAKTMSSAIVVVEDRNRTSFSLPEATGIAKARQQQKLRRERSNRLYNNSGNENNVIAALTSSTISSVLNMDRLKISCAPSVILHATKCFDPALPHSLQMAYPDDSNDRDVIKNATSAENVSSIPLHAFQTPTTPPAKLLALSVTALGVTETTLQARNLLLQSIKERVKRIE